MFLISLFLYASKIWAIQSEWNCKADLQLKAGSSTYTGTFKLDPIKYPTIVVNDGNKIIAKIFPQNGIHWVKKSKVGKLRVSTDKMHFIKLTYIQNGKQKQLICEDVW